ncbi:GPI mannosyltransferase 2, putative [Plasmodium vivax]|uniref:GPI mannosyltransferase 2 n=3 Tax=Plasmodium vivax TaxID=5855 RepID=A0A1G4H5T8_PLAVI|nr:hypothetical protein PVIIG_01526 [Plasmodium vivax India VII]KMZ96553.1 hypothetical protein PVNG_01950 [Plasmodium vivax North Korean]CAG9472545.1 unnamed protein product [Plasmodium vivax]CAI7723808.1 GPI mannosyltransferase 2, putative [Plasmodium vivax]SCO70220.1 GPI mannosyltransferase 2, putative [Plasmodium vivax]
MQDEGRAKPQQEEAARTKRKVAADVLTVATIALIVRALTAGYTIIWSQLINSYKSTNDLLCEGENSSLWNYVKCFSSWDGEYFLRLSLNETEYLYEQNHAFFPALPFVVGSLKRLLEGGFPHVSTCTMHMLIAIIANNFFFAFSAIGLYLFVYTSLSVGATPMGVVSSQKESAKKGATYMQSVKSAEDSRRLSFLAAILFTVNMGSIHMSSFYSESFFCCLSMWGFTFLQCSLNASKGSFTFDLLAVLCFSLASFFRSNGILFLIPLLVHNLRSCALCVHCAGVLPRGGEGDRAVKAKRLSCSSDEGHTLSRLPYKGTLLQFALHWAKALLEAALVVLPLLTFQLYAYHLYCVQGHDDQWREERKQFHKFFLSFWANPLEYASGERYTRVEDQLIRRPWCKKTIPFIYSYIQREYWGVKFLKVVRSPSAGVLYALPVYFVSLHAVYDFFLCRKFPRGGEASFLLSPFLGGVLHLGVLCLYLLLFAHGEIILRLIASSPLFYAHYAYQLKYSERWNLLLLANLLYFFVGPPLFGAYIAWT